MNVRTLAITTVAGALAGFAVYQASRPEAKNSIGVWAGVHSALPSESGAKALLNSSLRHREWVNVPVGSTGIRAFIVYPWRADQAPVAMVTEHRQSASPWVRAVADQIAAEGFIAVVPDVLSGAAPNGGDSDSFTTPEAVATALERMGRDEIARRTDGVRDYALSLPSSNGKSATLNLDSHDARIVAASAGHAASFKLDQEAWGQAVVFLDRETDNRPVFGVNPSVNVPEDHSAHVAMAMAQTAPQTKGGGRGYPLGKLPEFPAGMFTAKTALANSTLQKEYVDIPVGGVKLHTWVEYPAGNGKAPVAIVMQHGTGADDWLRALADQLAHSGFIAIAPDLFSGLGPNGGNWESFAAPDEVMRAGARLSEDETLRRYKSAWEFGMKLSRANGKSASIGFCIGGGWAFRFAADVPQLNAAVVFYGGPPDEAIMAKIKAPVIGFYGEDDARLTATVEPTTAAMKRLGKNDEPHIYPHATHIFLEVQDLGGNPAAVADAWPRAIAFLNQHTK